MQSKLTQSGLQILTPAGWVGFKPRQTKIIEAHNTSTLCIVREYYMGFVGSNVYAIDEELNVVWEAELPHPSDVFANVLQPSESGFLTSTWNGIKCFIDGKTGKVSILGISK